MKKRNNILGFIAIAIAMFMGVLDSTIMNIALPDITSYFKSTLNDTSWISTVYVLSLSVSMITASKLADQFGRKKVMILGLFLFGGSSALCGLSNSLMFLIVMRCLQGIGGAIITPLVVPIALDAFGKENGGIVAGAIGAITALAAAGGPPIGGLLIEYVNWQSIFFINVPFAVIAIILGIFFLRESYDHTASKTIDWVGMVLITAALFLLTFALLKGNDYGWNSAAIVTMFIGSGVSLVLFIVVELKVKAPMMEFSLFRELTFTASTVCYLITGFGIVAPGLIFNYFLQNAMGYQPLHAAMVVTPMALTVIVSMPLGTMLSSRMDSRLVNFLGIFGMSIGAFTLSRLTINTSEPMMIGEMIIYGFALGFAVQALISSIKYLPEEKSGMGSGIVNAARYIGTCIGIAILVSTLDIHVTNAKLDIRNSAIKDINSHTNIEASVKKVMIDDINENFENSDNQSMKQDDFKAKLEKDIREAIAKLKSETKPQNNDVLTKLYNGAGSLRDGAVKAADGQNKLSEGINSLNTGMISLKGGSASLTTGIKSLNNSITKVLKGSEQLKAAGAQGGAALTAGISKLDDGAQKMLSQFSNSRDSKNPSIYDAVTGLSGGAKSLSSNTASYVNAVNNTMFAIIKNDPVSPMLLSGFKDKLNATKAAYEQAASGAKQQYLQEIQMLNNLINLYTAGTDTSVTTVEQFEAKLEALAQQDVMNTTIVSGGAKLMEGTAKLAEASQRVAAQFSDGGSFKAGMEQIADGTGKLAQAGGKLNDLQEGMNKLSSSLSVLRNGAVKLYDGSQKLQAGIEKAQKGSVSLKNGSDELSSAAVKIKEGASELVSGIGLAGQESEIVSVMDKLSTNKNNEIASAFDRTFLIASIILALASILGLFTDKSSNTL